MRHYPAIKSHELAKILLEMPNLPVITSEGPVLMLSMHVTEQIALYDAEERFQGIVEHDRPAKDTERQEKSIMFS